MPFLVPASQRERREGNNYINKERQREEEGVWKGGVPLHENAAGMWMLSACVCVWMDTMFHPLFRRRQRSAGERQHSNEKADERIIGNEKVKVLQAITRNAPLGCLWCDFFLFRFPSQCSLVFNRSALGCSVYYNLQKKNNDADVTRAVFSQGH